MTLICLIEDDLSVREAITDLLQTVGWRVEAYASAEEFLAREPAPDPDCLLVDVGLPELSGLDLERHLRQAGAPVPVILMTGSADLPSSLHPGQESAVQVLLKPFDDRELLDEIARAVGGVSFDE